MFKQWFANLCNPTPAIKDDEDLACMMSNFGYDLSKENRLESEVRTLEIRLKNFRHLISVMASKKKEVNRFEFRDQLVALLRAQEAVAHQNMVPNKNDAVTRVLNSALQEEIARIYFMVFGDIDADPDEAEKEYSKYLNDSVGVLEERSK